VAVVTDSKSEHLRPASSGARVYLGEKSVLLQKHLGTVSIDFVAKLFGLRINVPAHAVAERPDQIADNAAVPSTADNEKEIRR
jgi:hypothetical protein